MVGLTYLKKDVCDAINAQLGTTTNTTPYNCSFAGDTSVYNGSFYNAGGNACSVQDGKRTGCLLSSRGGYTFWHVLEAQ